MIYYELFRPIVGSHHNYYIFINTLFWIVSLLILLFVLPSMLYLFKRTIRRIKMWDAFSKDILSCGIASVFIFFIAFFSIISFGINAVIIGWGAMSIFFAFCLYRLKSYRFWPAENTADNVVHNIMPGAMIASVIPMIFCSIIMVLFVFPTAYQILLEQPDESRAHNLDIKITASIIIVMLISIWYISAGIVGSILVALVREIRSKPKKNIIKKIVRKRRKRK